MKKLIMVVLAVFLMSGIASAATTMNVNGIVRVYPEMNNYGYTGGGGVPAASSTNSGTHHFVDQRAMLRFTAKSDENSGGHVALEIDSRWGNTASTTGAGSGGALNADTVNLELKSAYLWYQMGNLKTTVGVNTYPGDQTKILVSGDMAGLQLDYALSKNSALHTGAFTWFDQQTRASDAVYFIPLTVTQTIGGGKASIFAYTIQDQSNYQRIDSGSAFGPPFTRGFRPLVVNAFNTTTVILPAQSGTISVTGVTPTSPTGTVTPSSMTKAAYETADIYYAGLNYDGKAGNVSYYLMGVYNFGTFKNVITNSATNNNPGTVIGDKKISSFAANAKVDVKLGPGKLRFQALYAQGGGDDATDKYRGFVTGGQYQVAQTTPLSQMDLAQLLSGIDVLSHVMCYVPDVNLNGDGLQLAYLAYDHNLTPALNAQATLGYARADKLVSTSTRKGNEIGWEGNMHLRYKLSQNMNIDSVASYFVVGDYYKAKVTPAAGDPDNTYKLELKFKYAF